MNGFVIFLSIPHDGILRKITKPFKTDSVGHSKFTKLPVFFTEFWILEPLLWVIGIRLKEADSEASRCQDINFYRKKHRCFKSSATLINDLDEANCE